MQFTKQTIVIATKDGSVKEVEAMVGEGSGFAYHVSACGYCITAIATGYVAAHTDNLVAPKNLDDALDEIITQHFIENIANLLDWHQHNPQVVIAQAKERYPRRDGMFNELQKAFDKARKQAKAQEVQS